MPARQLSRSWCPRQSHWQICQEFPPINNFTATAFGDAFRSDRKGPEAAMMRCGGRRLAKRGVHMQIALAFCQLMLALSYVTWRWLKKGLSLVLVQRGHWRSVSSLWSISWEVFRVDAIAYSFKWERKRSNWWKKEREQAGRIGLWHDLGAEANYKLFMIIHKSSIKGDEM